MANPFSSISRLAASGDTAKNRRRLARLITKVNTTEAGRQRLRDLGVLGRSGINYGFLGAAPSTGGVDGSAGGGAFISGGGGGGGGAPQVSSGLPLAGPTGTQGSNETQPFVEALLSARPQILSQQQQLLQSLGSGLRSSILGASPELAATSNFLTSRVSEGLPEDLQQNYREQLRTAQAARGLEQGSGPAQQEARYLTALQERTRAQAVPQLNNLGFGLLQSSGLGAPPDVGLGTVGQLGLESRRLSEQVYAGERQSQLAQQMFDQFIRAFSPGGGGGTVAPFFGNAAGLPGVGTTPGSGTGIIGGIGSTNFPTLI